MKRESLLFVTNTDSDDISVVSTEQQREIARISVGGSPRGSVRFDQEKKFGYVSNCGGNTISVIDLNDFIEVSKITVGMAPRGLSIAGDENIAFISNSGSNTLSIVDLKSRLQIREFAMGRNPRHMAISKKANLLLVTEWGSDTVSIFHLNLDNKLEATSLKRSVFVGQDAKPYSVTINSNATKAYVANTKANYMSVIDLVDEIESDRIEVGYGGRAIAITPDDKYGFITTENTNEVVIITLQEKKVVSKVGVGFSPRGIALDWKSKLLYTADFDRSSGGSSGSHGFDSLLGMKNSITVLDVNNPLETRVVRQIQVGLGPCSVSILESN